MSGPLSDTSGLISQNRSNDLAATKSQQQASSAVSSKGRQKRRLRTSANVVFNTTFIDLDSSDDDGDS